MDTFPFRSVNDETISFKITENLEHTEINLIKMCNIYELVSYAAVTNYSQLVSKATQIYCFIVFEVRSSN